MVSALMLNKNCNYVWSHHSLLRFSQTGTYTEVKNAENGTG